MNTLYHYVHCPFCIRVRMALGYLNIKYGSKVLAYADEATPIALSGTKMLPIWQRQDGSNLNESLDIIKEVDPSNQLKKDFLQNPERMQWLELWLNKLGSNVHNLAMPYWVWTPEFDAQSRAYFVEKKSKKRGPFNLLAQKRPEFEAALIKDLTQLEGEFDQWLFDDSFSLADIMLASHLWGMYVVPEFRFSDKLHSYLQTVKKLCRFDYHCDFWRH